MDASGVGIRRTRANRIAPGLVVLPLDGGRRPGMLGAGARPFPVEAVEPAATDRPRFDGEAAFALLERQVAFGPRVPGTTGARAQLDWMRAWLGSRADTLSSSRSPTARRRRTLRLTNLFARFRPEERVACSCSRTGTPAPRRTRARPGGARHPGPRRQRRRVRHRGPPAPGRAAPRPTATHRRGHPAGGRRGLRTDARRHAARRHAGSPPTSRPATLRCTASCWTWWATATRAFRWRAIPPSWPLAARRVWGVAAALGYGDLFPAVVGRHDRGRPRPAQPGRDPHREHHRFRVRAREQLLAHAARRAGEHQRPTLGDRGGGRGGARLPGRLTCWRSRRRNVWRWRSPRSCSPPGSACACSPTPT
jgi:hypothetical protein